MQPTTTQPTLTYHGKLGQLYKLWIVNFLLNIVTLGIFSFWGKTRVRRYVVSQFSLNEDAFEYTGTGGELFRSFLLALVFFAVISIPLMMMGYRANLFYEANKTDFEQMAELQAQMVDEAISVEEEQHLSHAHTEISAKLFNQFIAENPYGSIIIALYAIFYFIYLPAVSRYGLLVYQMGHIRWRGIRGRQAGSALLFPFIKYFHLLLTFITLTLWMPFGDALIARYKLNRLYFGTQQGEHRPKFGRLFRSHILTLLMAILTFGLSRIWYHAALARMHTNDLTLGNIQFKSTITGTELFLLRIVNVLILMLTLGLGYPIVLQRNMRFMAAHTQVIGAIDELTVNQATGQKPTFGEGVSHWIDLGARFGTGYLRPYF